MSSSITIYKKKSITGTVENLPASKSISNRAIILNALCDNASTLSNLSNANDTQLMLRLIDSTNQELNVEDAGTTMRFLTAFNAITNRHKTLTGTDRMKHRPIGILVDALRTLGAEIDYLEKDGFPPVRTKGFHNQKNREIFIQGDVSSQYISALMMIGPTLPLGLHLKFKGKVTSLPYIEMTASLMKRYGVTLTLNDVEVVIPHQDYKPTQLVVEPDWSAASYWFAFVALSDDATLTLPSMTLASLQGDRVIVEMMDQLGVKSESKDGSLLLTKKEYEKEFSWDFTHCPDLAQTVAVVCAAKGINASFIGLESLRIKETDRIKALQMELGKLGCRLEEHNGKWILTPGTIGASPLLINTYLDHRMAMAFAPLATCTDITIEDLDVVRKSYPLFWKDVQSLGFTTAIS